MKLLLCAVSLLCAGSIFAAGSVSETRAASDPPQKVTLAWTAALDGTVAVTSQPVRGEMSRVVFYNGTPAPTNSTYAVTLKDESGVDLLAGQGSAVASNAVGSASQIIPGALVVSTTGITNLFPVVVNGKLSLGISGVGTNATAGKQGVVILYLK
jgi:hypothetical protein